MSGTREGGLKAVKKTLERDPDFYRKIATLSHKSWEENGRKPRGFGTFDEEKRKRVASKGGTISRKGKKV